MTDAMVAIGELISCLGRVLELLEWPGSDLGWGCHPYASVDELRDDVVGHLKRIEAGFDDVWCLRLLFAPTGSLQEAAVASGWADEYLKLAARFDEAASG